MKAVAGGPAAVYLARLARGSRPTMRASLRLIACYVSGERKCENAFPWHELTYRQTAAVRSYLADNYAPNTANKMLAALRGVLREAWRLGLMDAEAFQRAADLGRIRGESLPRGRALSAGELSALFDVCARGRGKAGPRDAALLGLLYGGGLRRAEAVALNLNDWKPEEAAVAVLSSKGRKSRLVPLPHGAAEAVRSWVRVRGADPGPLLLAVPKGGWRIEKRRLQEETVRLILRRRARQARIDDCSPHDMRRTFVSDLLDHGADLATVQRLAGHSNPQTTTRYDRRGEAAKRKAADMIHVPFHGRGGD